MTARLKWKLTSQRARLVRRMKMLNREHRQIRKQIEAIELLSH